MSRDLEALLEAYDALRSAPVTDAKARRAFYELRLQEAAAKLNLSPARLHQMIQRKYPRWLRAQERKPPSIPPSA